jgi:WD40 repeat protein
MPSIAVASGQDSLGPVPGLIRQFGDASFHTDGDVHALIFAMDRNLRSIEDRGILRFWSADGRVLRESLLSEFEALWLFAPGGQIIASASDELALWDGETGRLLFTREQPSWITALAFSADGRHTATGHDDGIVRIWSVADGELVQEVQQQPSSISAVAFDPKGTRLAAATEGKEIALWDLNDKRLIGRLIGHVDRINSLLWHPDGKDLVSGAWDSTARVWDTATLYPVILLNAHATQVTALAFSPDGQTLAAADSDSVIHLWDFTTYLPGPRLLGHTRAISALSFNSDGRKLASGGEDHFIHIWDTTSGVAMGPVAAEAIAGHPRCALALSPDAAHLATCLGRALRLWRVSDSNLEWESIHPSPILALGFSRDGRWLAAGCGDATIRVWDHASQQLHRELHDDLFWERVTCVAFSPDSTTLAAASSATMSVWLWNIEKGEPELLIPDPLEGCAIETLAYHPQKRLLAVGGIDWLATGGSNGAISLWDLDGRCEIATFGEGTGSLAFHPSGQLLASTTLARSICIWDLETRTLALELAGQQAALTSVAYSPDGVLLAGGSLDRMLRLWESRTGRVLATVVLRSEPRSLAFSPDSRHLFTANANGTVSQLDVAALLESGNAA